MAPETFTLSNCTPDDIPGMVEVNFRAFADDPLNKITLPRDVIGEIELRRWMTQFLASFFEKPEVHFYKITETNTGTLAAWMRCAFPHVLSEEESEKRKKEKDAKLKDKSFWPKGANFDVIDAKFGVLGQLKEKYCDDTETYYVQLLATDPTYQRRGLASRLLKHMLQLADEQGKMAYIEATALGFPVYQKLGFKQVDIVEVDLSKYGGKGTASNRIMQREPQPVL
ncbi:acyl-CoA N-acyltransferase [Stipitochalara longipes BDJ]|nr:acyl-CoA N-acyltransferase [Stipitochalara longipes BDJ]